MRTKSLAIVLVALAGIHLTPCPAHAQLLGDADRYAQPAAEPAILPEDVPPSAAEEASPSVPLEQPDIPQVDPAPWSGTLGGAVGGADVSGSEPARVRPRQTETPPPSRPQSIPSDAARQQAQPITSSPAADGKAATPFTPRTSAKDLLAGMLSPPAGAELAGEPLSLSDAMEGIYGSDRQREIVSAYWQLTMAVGKYCVASRARPASAESRAELGQAKLTAVRAQHRLAQVLQWNDRRLPLPLTQPHSGSYNTRFDEIFVGRASRRAWELDQTLPLLYDLMKARAEALAANSTGGEAAAAAYQFLDTVREYNLAIAEYALLAAGDSLTGRELVPLLIRIDRSEEDEEHVAGADDGLGKTSSRTGNPRAGTPRRAMVDPRVVRTSGEQSTAVAERSILAQPPQRTSATSTDEWRERDPARTP